MRKRVLSGLLALVMCLSLLPVNVLADVSAVTAPTIAQNLTYTGAAQALATAGEITKTDGDTVEYKFQYSTDNSTWAEDPPTGTDAKEYTVYWRVVNADGSEVTVQDVTTSGNGTVTIGKGTNEWTTAGTAATLSAGSTNEALLTTAPEAKWGTVSYTVTKDGTAVGSESNTIPTSSGAGAYVVTCKVPADGGNYDELSKTFSVTVDKGTVTPDPAVTFTWTVKNGDTPVTGSNKAYTTQLVEGQNVTVSVVASEGTATLSCTGLTPGADGALTLTEAETYEITATAGDASEKINVVVQPTGEQPDPPTPAEPEKLPTPTSSQKPKAVKASLPYTGAAQALVKIDKPIELEGVTYKFIVKDEKAAPAQADWESAVELAAATGTDAGTYYVYWMIDGGEGYTDYTPSSGNPITVKIAGVSAAMPADAELTTTATYGDTLEKVGIPSGDAAWPAPTFNDEAVEGTWAWADEETSVGSAGTNTLAGAAVFTPTDTNIAPVTADVTVEVARAQVDADPVATQDAYNSPETQIMPPAPKGAQEYTGKPLQLLGTAGKFPSGSTVEYWVDKETPTAAAVFSGVKETNAGKYTIKYKVKLDANHEFKAAPVVSDTPDTPSGQADEPVTEKTFTVMGQATISKAASSVTTAPVGAQVEGDGKTAKALIKTKGVAAGGELWYKALLATETEPDAPADVAADANGWSTDIKEVTGTEAGSYRIYYFVKGDANHEDTEVAYVPATIGQGKVTVTFDMDGGGAISGKATKAVTIAGGVEGATLGDYIPDPADVTMKDGNQFLYWASVTENEDGTTTTTKLEASTEVPKNATTYFAMYAPYKLTVKLTLGEGDDVKGTLPEGYDETTGIATLVWGDKLTMTTGEGDAAETVYPVATAKEGYKFKGWAIVGEVDPETSEPTLTDITPSTALKPSTEGQTPSTPMDEAPAIEMELQAVFEAEDVTVNFKAINMMDAEAVGTDGLKDKSGLTNSCTFGKVNKSSIKVPFGSNLLEELKKQGVKAEPTGVGAYMIEGEGADAGAFWYVLTPGDEEKPDDLFVPNDKLVIYKPEPAVLAAGAIVDAKGNVAVTEDITLAAVFVPTTYDVTLVWNNGLPALEEGAEDPFVSAPKLVQADYTFPWAVAPVVEGEEPSEDDPPLATYTAEMIAAQAENEIVPGMTFVGWSLTPTGKTPIDLKVPTDAERSELYDRLAEEGRTPTTNEIFKLFKGAKVGANPEKLYAIWQPKTYTAKFDVNWPEDAKSLEATYADKVTEDKDITAVIAEEMAAASAKLTGKGKTETFGKNWVLATNPTLKGYKFLGWTLDEALDAGKATAEELAAAIVTTKDKVTDEVAKTASPAVGEDGPDLTKPFEVTLYAVWQPNQVKVTLNGNTGKLGWEEPAKSTTLTKDGEGAALTVPFDSTWADFLMKIDGVKTDRPGYTFQGWALKKAPGTGETKDEILLANANDATVAAASSVTLYAIWKGVTYNVEFWDGTVDDKGELEAKAKIASGTDNWSAADPDPVASEGVVQVEIGGTYEALWRFDGVKNKKTDIEEGAGADAKIPDDVVPKKVGKDFAGWYTKPDGKGSKITRTSKLTNLNAYDEKYYEGPADPTDPSSNGTIKLFAKWTNAKVVVKFAGLSDEDAKTNTFKAPANKTITYNSKVSSLPTARLAGYDFWGWAVAADPENDKAKLCKDPTEVSDATAGLTDLKGKIMANGTNTESAKYVTEDAIKMGEDGKWTITLYPIFTPKSYNVTLRDNTKQNVLKDLEAETPADTPLQDAKGKPVNTQKIKIYKDQKVDDTLADVYNFLDAITVEADGAVGYTYQWSNTSSGKQIFKDWLGTLQKDENGDPVADGALTWPAKNLTLYAVRIANKYDVELNLTKGADAENHGYLTNGWGTAKGFKGASGDTELEKADAKKDATKWTKEDGLTYGRTVGALPTPRRTGYKFLGWTTLEDYSSLIDKETGKLTTDKELLKNVVKSSTKVADLVKGSEDTKDPIKLYPIWVANTYTLTIKANGGKWTQEYTTSSGKTATRSKTSFSVKVPFDSAPDLSEMDEWTLAERTGYTNDSKYYVSTRADAKEFNTSVQWTVAKNQTVYLHWEKTT